MICEAPLLVQEVLSVMQVNAAECTGVTSTVASTVPSVTTSSDAPMSVLMASITAVTDPAPYNTVVIRTINVTFVITATALLATATSAMLLYSPEDSKKMHRKNN